MLRTVGWVLKPICAWQVEGRPVVSLALLGRLNGGPSLQDLGSLPGSWSSLEDLRRAELQETYGV